MLDAEEFAFLAMIGSMVATMIWLTRHPLDKSVTFGMVVISFAFVILGMVFIAKGMDALDTNKMQCGRRLRRHLCQRDDVDFWLWILMFYVAAVSSISAALRVIFTPFVKRRASR